MRMVVDLGDLDRSRWVNLTGESGHVGSAHYLDQTPLWIAGRTLPWAFARRPSRERPRTRWCSSRDRAD